jgi:hypothetical protein
VKQRQPRHGTNQCVLEAQIKIAFAEARAALTPTPPPHVESPEPPSDWAMLTRIQRILDHAFSSGDWPKAKREIQALKRRAQIRIVKG